MQEVFPAAFARLEQCLRRGEPFDERPRRRRAPILERLQCDGIILVKCLLKLIDKCRALFNQRHFIPAQQPQPLHQRFWCGQHAPAFSFQTQRIGQCPAIPAVSLRAAGQLARAIRFGTARMHRINAIAQHHQSFNDGAMPGFDRDGQFWKLFQLFLAELPTNRGVVKPKLAGDFSRAIQDQHIVMILRPIESGEVRDFLPCFHFFRFLSFGCGGTGRSDPVHSRPNTAALAGQSSLRLLNTSRWRRRFS